MTTNAGRLLAGLLLLAASAVASPAGRLEFERWEAIEESLRRMPPRLRTRWLDKRGLEMPGWNAPLQPASQDYGGLRLVGKWGRGPSVEVTGRDSLVFLSLGSEVAIVNISDPSRPRVLAEVQAMGLVAQSAVRDSFLYVGCPTGRAGIEVWNIADPTQPVFRSYTPSLLTDFCISDTFLYLTQALSGQNDTFKVYSTGNPAGLRLLGTCRDSGYAIAVTGSAAVIAHYDALFAIDVSNPAAPHRVGSYPGWAVGIAARGRVCYASLSERVNPAALRLVLLDVGDPSAIRPLGSVDSCGGFDMHLRDTLLLASGYDQGTHGFVIVDVADSTRPAVVGNSTPMGSLGVWSGDGSAVAVLADNSGGMALLDMADPRNPSPDTSILCADRASDVRIAGDYCYVADEQAGTKVLRILGPGQLSEVASVDSGRVKSSTVAVKDSFAFLDWSPEPLMLRTYDVSNPANPRQAGALDVFNGPEHMLVRDSFLYIAENYKFEVLNVARPRQPRVVGTVSLPDRTFGMYLWDTLAYIANSYSVSIVNIAQPTSPRIVGSVSGYPNGIDRRDSFLFVVNPRYLASYNLSNPVAPVLLDTVMMAGYMHDVVVLDTIAYCGGWDLQAVSIADPSNLHLLPGRWVPPSTYIRRLTFESPYIYAACTDGGVCVLEPTQTGVSEERPGGGPGRATCVLPNPTRGEVRLRAAGAVRGWRVIDVTGRVVMAGPAQRRQAELSIDLRRQPPGVYCIEVVTASGTQRSKVIRVE